MDYSKIHETAVDYDKAVEIFGVEMGMNKAQAKRELNKLMEAEQISLNGPGGFPIQPEEFIERVRALK